MKRLYEHDTPKALLISFLISHLILAPLVFDICIAQTGAVNLPVIAHQPAKIARRGQPLSITAHVGAGKGISSVILKIDYDGQSVKGPMPQKKDSGVVPVVVQIINGDLDVFSGASALNQKIGVVKRSDKVFVTAQKDGYYRIITAGDLVGYIDAEKTAVIQTGYAYGVTIPATMTRKTLSYQIIARDKSGQVAQSEAIVVDLLSEDEIAEMRTKPQSSVTAAKRAQPQALAQSGKSSQPFYKKAWFWLGLTAIGGGAYYYTTQKDSEEETSTVNVTVGWN
jgi:hypothetical protein